MQEQHWEEACHRLLSFAFALSKKTGQHNTKTQLKFDKLTGLSTQHLDKYSVE